MHRPSLILPLLLFAALLSDCSASLTLLITGHSSANVHKHELARQFVESYDEIIKDAMTAPMAMNERHLLGIWDDMRLPANITTIIVTDRGTDHMNHEQLQILQRLIKVATPLIVIEFGTPAKQTRPLLDQTVTCLLSGHAIVGVPNVAYFCNSASPAQLSTLQFDTLRDIKPVERRTPQPAVLLPIVFVSARVERRHHEHRYDHHGHHHHALHDYHHHHRHKHFDEDVDEIVDQIMEEIVERGPVAQPEGPVKEPTEAQKKLACKFRKSCYETGTRPTIDSGIVKFFARLIPKWPSEEPVVVEKHDISTPYNPEEDLVDQKVRCKYRTSCYIERGIPIDEKAEAKKKAMISQKSVPLQKGKKKTLKEIAAHTIKKMQEAEQRAAQRPVIKIIQKRLNAAEEKRNEKLNCKYRKSCYETGEKPVIESAWALPLPMKIFSTESAEKVAKEINYEELEELEKKLYCKYRKSCYETGVKPEIEPEIFIRTFADLTTLHEQVETRKLTLKEKCKYRKSCYETGIVPEINPKLEAAIHKDVSSVIPTNAADLRLLCKYRKSCYEEVHNSATVDTIKFIRKRRQIEKEVRRRKARRVKLHRRLRGELKLGSYRSHRRIGDKKHADAEDQPALEETFLRSIKEEAPEEEQQVESTPSKSSKTRKSKQPKKAAAKEEVVVEPIVEEAAIETEDEEPPQVKKLRKGKKAKPEEPKAEKPVAGAKLRKKKEPEQTPEEKEKLDEESAKLKKKKEPEPKSEEEREKRDEEPVKLKKKKKEREPKPEEEKEKRDEEPTKLKKKKKEPEPKPEEEEHEEQAAPQDSEPVTKRLDTAAEVMKKMIDNMHHQQEIQQSKEFCKYRKSCYESGKRPEIDQSIQHLLEKFSEHVDRELSKEQEVVHLKTDTEKKLECKYRKSCYETGILPDIKAHLEPSEEKPIVFKAGMSKQLQCKYRKSCYVEAGLSTPQDVGDAKQKGTPGAKKISEHVKVSSDARKGDAAGARKLFKPEEAATAGAAVRSSTKEKVDGECKPGQKSCYSSAEPRALNEDEAGTMARTGLNRYRETGWCNQYYYSCREILGLPPKERAPIGPNGKRLCRKKKPLDSLS